MPEGGGSNVEVAHHLSEHKTEHAHFRAPRAPGDRRGNRACHRRHRHRIFHVQ